MTTHYFDHAASAPRRDDVTAAMAPWMHGVVGNPSGSHAAARRARQAVEDARDEIAAFMGVAPGGVIFTGGGTESCTLAVTGVVRAQRGRHPVTTVVTSAIEHHAVLDAATMMCDEFSDVRHVLVGVDHDGVVLLDDLAAHLGDDVALVSVMAANNETGVIQPLGGVVAAIAHSGHSPLTHTDAVAAAPWLDLTEVTRDIDLITLCGHKLGGPVNAGVLAMRESVSLAAMAPGGGQERGYRGGTVDVAAAVGLAAAVRATTRDRLAGHERLHGYQRQFHEALASLPGAHVTALTASKLPGTVHVTFEGIASDELLFLLDRAGIYASAASSCSSGAAISSHVLDAMGVAPTWARGSLRLTMGHETTDDDVAAAIAAVRQAVLRLHPDASPAKTGKLSG